MKYGLLSYDTFNLGDEIQSIAARRFLPRVDCLVNRETLDVDPGEPVRLILNGWYMHQPWRWPPHPAYDALPVSIHLTRRRPSRWRIWRQKPAGLMLREPGVRWFREHGPVGARDADTMRQLQRKGIDAHESGCLTLTLPRQEVSRGDYVVACDLPPEMLAVLAARTRSRIIETSHDDRTTKGFAARMEKAEALLDLYGRARAVVTTRLHCALPCLALGTPVLFIRREPDLERQTPALELAHHCEPDDFMAGRTNFDADAPLPNPDRHLARAAALAERCNAFIAR